MLESKAYKTYHAYATGKRLKTSAKVTKPVKKKQPITMSKAKSLNVLSKVALSEAEQMKLAAKRSKTQFHSSHASGLGADEGTGVSPGVPNVPIYDSEDEQISWKSSDEDDNDEVNMSEDDDNKNDDNADNEDDDNQNNDNADNEDEEDKEAEWSVDEAYDDKTQGVNVDGKELDEDETNKEDKTNVQGTQVIEDTHVIITAITPEVPQQNSSISSGFISNMLNHNPDTGIDSILNLNTESTSLVDVPVTTNVEMPPSSVTTLPPPPIPFIQPQQQTPIPTLTIVPIVSLIPSNVDMYLANKMNEVVKIAVQLQSDRLRDEAQAENEDFINTLDENMRKFIKKQVKEQVKEQVSKILPKIKKFINDQLKAEVLTCSSNQAKTSYVVAANLSELQLKKIFIDKIKNNKSIDKSIQQKTLQYIGSKRRRASKEAELTSAPKEKTSKSSGKTKEGSKSHHTSTSKSVQAEEPIYADEDLEEPAHQEFDTRFTKDQPVDETTQHPDWFQKPTKPPTPDHDWNKTLPSKHGPVQPWISTLARNEDPRESFNKLMDTPLDFSLFMMNRLKVDTLTPELLAGQTYELMKVIPFDHFINNDLAYLSGGVSSRTDATSVTKTKATDYEHIKWIEYFIPNSMESARDVYSKHIILAVTKLKIVEWHNYKHLDWITVRRNDDKLHTFKEGDYNRLRLQDIEDISLVLRRRVEDLQLCVETYSNPKGFMYQNKDKKNRLMCIDELHKFSDGTLNDVRSALDDILKQIRMEYLPQTV
ncbi:hypothetical protein Tco_0025338 [Tanacetum coccineum]